MSQAIRRLPGQRRGFSLAELMAVLALLGALLYKKRIVVLGRTGFARLLGN